MKHVLVAFCIIWGVCLAESDDISINNKTVTDANVTELSPIEPKTTTLEPPTSTKPSPPPLPPSPPPINPNSTTAKPPNPKTTTTTKPTVPTTTSNPHTSTKSTTISTTVSPVTTPKIPSTTVVPQPNNRKFDGPSFVGGIVLASGLMAIGFVAFKFYKARTERNYHTL